MTCSRHLNRLALLVLLSVAGGCGKSDKPSGPVVDSFTGSVVADGKPVSFPPADQVEIMLFSDKGSQLRVPISPEGTFKLGWMPVGKHTASLTRMKSIEGKKGGQTTHSIPGGLDIVEGKTEYTIELGKNFKL